MAGEEFGRGGEDDGGGPPGRRETGDRTAPGLVGRVGPGGRARHLQRGPSRRDREGDEVGGPLRKGLVREDDAAGWELRVDGGPLRDPAHRERVREREGEGEQGPGDRGPGVRPRAFREAQGLELEAVHGPREDEDHGRGEEDEQLRLPGDAPEPRGDRLPEGEGEAQDEVPVQRRGGVHVPEVVPDGGREPREEGCGDEDPEDDRVPAEQVLPVDREKEEEGREGMAEGERPQSDGGRLPAEAPEGDPRERGRHHDEVEEEREVRELREGPSEPQEAVRREPRVRDDAREEQDRVQAHGTDLPVGSRRARRTTASGLQGPRSDRPRRRSSGVRKPAFRTSSASRSPRRFRYASARRYRPKTGPVSNRRTATEPTRGIGASAGRIARLAFRWRRRSPSSRESVRPVFEPPRNSPRIAYRTIAITRNVANPPGTRSG